MKIDRQETITVEMTFDEVQAAVKAHLVKEGRCAKKAVVNLVIVGVEVDGQTFAVGSKLKAVEAAAERPAIEAPSFQTPTPSKTIPATASLWGPDNQIVFALLRDVTIGGQLVTLPHPCPPTIFRRSAVLYGDGWILLQGGHTPDGAIVDKVEVHTPAEVSIFLTTGEIPVRFRK